MGLVELLKRLITSKPELRHPRPIEGTSLIEGFGEEGIIIYDSRTNKVLFGGANPDLGYIGRLNGKHVGRKQEEVDERWKTYFVDESGNILFGRKYDYESLALVDSNSEEYVDINLNDLDPVTSRGKLRGTEDLLVEYVQNNYDEGTLNIYDENGRVIAKNIPAFTREKEEKRFEGDAGEVMCPATRFCFANVEGQLLFEVKYGQESKLYELIRT